MSASSSSSGIQEETLRSEFNALSDGSTHVVSPAGSRRSQSSINMSALRTKSSRRSSAYSEDQVRQLIELFPEISHLKKRAATEENLEELFPEALEELVEILGDTKRVERELFRRKEARLKELKKKEERESKKTGGVRFASDDNRGFECLESDALRRAGIAEQALANASAARDKVTTLYKGLLSTTLPTQCDPKYNAVLEDKSTSSSVEKVTQKLAPYPNNSVISHERWEALRAEARVIITRRLLVGWKMMAQYCKGAECGDCPLLIKQNNIQCVVCGGTGNGKDGIYANKVPETKQVRIAMTINNDTERVPMNAKQTNIRLRSKDIALIDGVLSPTSEDSDDTPSRILGELGKEPAVDYVDSDHASDKENSLHKLVKEGGDEDEPPDEFENLLNQTKQGQNRHNSVIVYDLEKDSIEVQESTEGVESFTSQTSNKDYFTDDSAEKREELPRVESQQTESSDHVGQSTLSVSYLSQSKKNFEAPTANGTTETQQPQEMFQRQQGEGTNLGSIPNSDAANDHIACNDASESWGLYKDEHKQQKDHCQLKLQTQHNRQQREPEPLTNRNGASESRGSCKNEQKNRLYHNQLQLQPHKQQRETKPHSKETQRLQQQNSHHRSTLPENSQQSSGDEEEKHEVLEEANTIISKSGVTVKRMKVGKAILQKTEEGWSLIDASCQICDMPLLIDPKGEEELCVFCEVNRAEVLVDPDRATPSEITDIFHERQHQATKPPPESVTVVRQSTGSHSKASVEQSDDQWEPGSGSNPGDQNKLETNNKNFDPDLRRMVVASPGFDERGMFPFLKEKNNISEVSRTDEQLHYFLERAQSPNPGLGIKPRNLGSNVNTQYHSDLHPDHFEALQFVNGKQTQSSSSKPEAHYRSERYLSERPLPPHFYTHNQSLQYHSEIQSPDKGSHKYYQYMKGEQDQTWRTSRTQAYHFETRHPPHDRGMDPSTREPPSSNVHKAQYLRQQRHFEVGHKDVHDHMKTRVTENIKADRANAAQNQHKRTRTTSQQTTPYAYKMQSFPQQEASSRRPSPHTLLRRPTSIDSVYEQEVVVDDSSNIYAQIASAPDCLSWQQELMRSASSYDPATIFSRQHDDQPSTGLNSSQSNLRPFALSQEVSLNANSNFTSKPSYGSDQSNAKPITRSTSKIGSSQEGHIEGKESSQAKASEQYQTSTDEELLQSRSKPLIDELSASSTKQGKSLSQGSDSESLISSIRLPNGTVESGSRSDPPDEPANNSNQGSRSSRDPDERKLESPSQALQVTRSEAESVVLSQSSDLKGPDKADKDSGGRHTFKVEPNKQGGYSIIVPEDFDFTDELKLKDLVLLAKQQTVASTPVESYPPTKEKNADAQFDVTKDAPTKDENADSQFVVMKDAGKDEPKPSTSDNDQALSLIDFIRAPARRREENEKEARSDPPTCESYRRERSRRDPDDGDGMRHLEPRPNNGTKRDPISPSKESLIDPEESRFKLTHSSSEQQNSSRNSRRGNDGGKAVTRQRYRKCPKPESPMVVGDLSSEAGSSNSRHSSRSHGSRRSGLPIGPSDEDSGVTPALAPRVQSPYFSGIDGLSFNEAASSDSSRRRKSFEGEPRRAPSMGEEEASQKLTLVSSRESGYPRKGRRKYGEVARSSGRHKFQDKGSSLPPRGERQQAHQETTVDCNSTFSSWSTNHSSARKLKNRSTNDGLSGNRPKRGPKKSESPIHIISRSGSSQTSWPSSRDKKSIGAKKPPKYHPWGSSSIAKESWESPTTKKEKIGSSRGIKPRESRSLGSYSSWGPRDKSHLSNLGSPNSSHRTPLKVNISVDDSDVDEEEDMFFVGGPLDKQSTATGMLSPASSSSDSTPFEHILNRCKEKMGQLSFSDETDRFMPSKTMSFTTGGTLHINLVDHEDMTANSGGTGRSSRSARSSSRKSRASIG